MNNIPENEIAKLPSDEERKKIFYWLQRVSSVTAWRRILELYKTWASTVQESVRIADLKGWSNETSLPDSEYIGFLKCLVHCEQGVRRLGKGDKRVFKFDANGEFEMGSRKLGHWSIMMGRLEIGENGISPQTPLWPQFCDTLMAVGTAWGECGPHILEPRYLDEPGLTLYGDWLEKKLTEMPFPEDLPFVPSPINDVFVRTNEFTPYSGIWEPIATPGPVAAGALSLFTRTPKPKPPYRIVGAMNYLHGGSRAPRISVETAGDIFDLNTTWRLLWRDDRYEDGTVPEAESQYAFTEPQKFLTRPAFWLTGERTFANTGEITPVSGKWIAESDPSISVDIERGRIMPLHDGSVVRWVLSRT